MLFTWDTTNLCIVFKSWQITGTWSLLWSLVAVAALTAGYEVVREASRRFEERQSIKLEDMPRKSARTTPAASSTFKHTYPPKAESQPERSSFLWSGSAASAQEQRNRIIKAILYGIQVFYSFFIM